MQNTKTYTVEEAMRVLEKYCVYQDRCHLEVSKKLHTMNMIQDAKDMIMVHLIQHDFLNEERYAKSFVRGKFYYKNWGKIKITKYLRSKNIGVKIIETALKEIDEKDYLETLKSLLEKKIHQIKANNTFEKRKKSIYFLQSKGYELPLIMNVLEELFKNQKDK